jgi:hypothetical protein
MSEDRSLEQFKLRPGDLFGLTWSGESITVEVQEIVVEGNGCPTQVWLLPEDGTVQLILRKLSREQVNAMLDAYISEYQKEIFARRAADPGYIAPVENDWREQTVVEVGELEAPGDRGEVRGDPQ